MKTAVDTSVLLDVMCGDPEFGERSREALRTAYDKGALVVCDVVWAEVRALFESSDKFDRALRLLGVRYEPVSIAAATAAGSLWQRASGRKLRVPTDFLVGAHAVEAGRLLTRDRGFYRRHFPDLLIIDPSHPA